MIDLIEINKLKQQNDDKICNLERQIDIYKNIINNMKIERTKFHDKVHKLVGNVRVICRVRSCTRYEIACKKK